MRPTASFVRSFRSFLAGTKGILIVPAENGLHSIECQGHIRKSHLRTAFDLLDRDQDGHVTPEELQFMLRNLGIHVRDELIDDLLREASRTARTLHSSVSCSKANRARRMPTNGIAMHQQQMDDRNGRLKQRPNHLGLDGIAIIDCYRGLHHSELSISGSVPVGSGLIDETEFLQWVARIQALKDDSNTSSSSSSSNNPAQSADDDLTQDLVAAFRVFDRDGNGYITRDELKSAMDMIGENVTEYQLNEMLELADADKDGRINYEDFQNFFLNNIDTLVQPVKK
ncbi:hypothetical protein AND_007914 [Anopheles darlingi]|uniref:EF-hand domain-containing protein n=1 Tax=Anopheles darlingi TaxID=43151 RepID=W5J7L2_ANODA|nr:hypothetical protein AND_007914 [Anopheles darlingi]